MNTFSKNLITYLIYGISLCLFYIIPCFFEIISIPAGTILFFIFFILLNILAGYKFSFKEFIWGIVAIEIQFVLCQLFVLNLSPNEEIPTIIAFGNMIFDFIEHGNSLLRYVISAILPIACIMTGFGIKKLPKKSNESS